MKMSDIVVVGAGHNGLVCGFYLAAQDLKVKIVEKRAVVGGAAVTEKIPPGIQEFRSRLHHKPCSIRR
jgi:phytoene dehydrogenase-like protein